MELLEYMLYNYNQRNEMVIQTLTSVVNKFSEEDGVDENFKREIYKALSLSKGYTQYKAKELATQLGVSKSAIKYMISILTEENKIELVKENNITFLVPIF